VKPPTAALALALAFVFAAATAVAAGGTARTQTGSDADPSRLVLARADFPSSTKYTWGRMPASFTQGLAALGVKSKGAYYVAELRRSGSTKYESVNGLVVTTGSAAQARTTYAAFMREAREGPKSVLRLPPYGDQQIALYQSPKVGSRVVLLVRRNTVVWQLEVAGEGLLVIPKPTLLAELKKYAAKQKARIGTG
jgi:hypothetical protein